jgi:hypothetical protein
LTSPSISAIKESTPLTIDNIRENADITAGSWTQTVPVPPLRRSRSPHCRIFERRIEEHKDRRT